MTDQNSIEPCRCVYPDKCFCSPEQKAAGAAERSKIDRALSVDTGARERLIEALVEKVTVRLDYPEDGELQGYREAVKALADIAALAAGVGVSDSPEVWIGIVVPAPDHPARPEQIAQVFASKDAAMEWQIEGPPPSANSAYRRVERHALAGVGVSPESEQPCYTQVLAASLRAGVANLRRTCAMPVDHGRDTVEIRNSGGRWWAVLEKGTRAVLVTQVTQQQAIHFAHCIQAATGHETFVEEDPWDAIGANIAPIWPWHQLVARGWVPPTDYEDRDPELGPNGEEPTSESAPKPVGVGVARPAAIEWNAHEGMVTVYDHDGHYMGCMGINAWRHLVENEAGGRSQR